jgi:rubrerythrin
VDFSQIQSTASLLETFVTFEQDTILFYEFLQAFIQDAAALEGLKKIIDEEKKHVAELKEMIQAIDPQKTRGQRIES